MSNKNFYLENKIRRASILGILIIIFVIYEPFIAGILINKSTQCIFARRKIPQLRRSYGHLHSF